MAKTKSQALVESRGAANEAGLTYTDLHRPGILRKKRGTGFYYIAPNGKQVTDKATLHRIKSLVIPPAYQQVWINSSARGHIQAVGKDARGRTQYRYHPRWRHVRDQSKYERMISFAHVLPKLRSRVRRDLKLEGLPRNKVLATIVKLLETTLIRVGNDEYARTNKSFGLTTIRNRHVAVNGSHIHFEFRGKSGIEHAIDLNDKRLARVIKKCQDLPEQELFEFVDERGKRHDITSSDVNNYLQEITGKDFTAKDFRTWAGTVLAAMALREFETFDSQTQAKKNVVAAIESVAKKLGNTRAVCRKCYVHPEVLDAYLDGQLIRQLKQKIDGKLSRSLKSFRPEEAAVMVFLERRLARRSTKKR